MSRWWYLACLVPPTIATVIGLVLFLGSMESFRDTRIQMPGERTFELGAGSYVIEGIDSRDPKAITCTVRDAAGGTPALAPSKPNANETERHTYHDLFDVTLAAGTYTVRCEGAGTPEVRIRRRPNTMVVYQTIGLSIAGTILAGILALLIHRRRKR